MTRTENESNSFLQCHDSFANNSYPRVSVALLPNEICNKNKKRIGQQIQNARRELNIDELNHLDVSISDFSEIRSIAPPHWLQSTLNNQACGIDSSEESGEVADQMQSDQFHQLQRDANLGKKKSFACKKYNSFS